MSGYEQGRFDDSIELEAALELATQALAIVDAKYGVGGQNPKGYHNLVHSRDDVIGGIIELADQAIASGKITQKDKALLIIGGAFHDTEQDLGSGPNEMASAEAARAAMAQTGIFTSSDANTVEQIIMSTQVYFENGIMLQSASEDNLLEQIMTDADLSSLGRDTQTYWSRTTGLFTEMFGNNPSLENQITFLEHQVRLLRNHVYYTDEARVLFPHQAENLEYSEAILASLVM